MSTTTVTDTTPQTATGAAAVLQPLWVRVMHWINAAAMLAMIMSGWQIYNAAPLFDFQFSRAITLGGWLGGGLLWHFAAMWVLVINGMLYVGLGFATGRFRRKLWPITPSGVISDLSQAVRLRLSHDDLGRYNSVQKLLYAGILLVGVVTVASGLAIWKPVQFHMLTALFGGYDTARYVHFFAMTAIVGFLVIHIALAALVPKALRAIIIGR
ncbi:thiosulfate reductase cytochrome b subunit [Rhodopseudomonas thermotolerans]|uniref:Thiosulfate reductase cytochrome b subunit n=2 Tax=Rhodopseudomonas TaxID=1073 RepID=A0A336JXX8_9BRAD|nr:MULTISPECIES: cytochrome b/b6 domain-containing protein [Rhodopseudomonas]RED28572.1 thiosulfate reductase cytochrome b subunit [Rhodopseudomonas pentothenatexigens]REF91491.1 thiosulfate reductase cytochrome b subunit [Rhodopseudomonas thermotolerans]SSW92514.1 thiosulfate reductase cytochrome b subunit [Rhodopseudomonas pentothenatexigens]